MATSISSAPARPIMSAPTPRAGSSTMWANASASSPTTTSAASRGESPGHEPLPAAVAKTLIGQPYWRPATTLDAGKDPKKYVATAAGVVLRGADGHGMYPRGGWRRGPGVRTPWCPVGCRRRRSSVGPVADARDHRHRGRPHDHPDHGRQPTGGPGLAGPISSA